MEGKGGIGGGNDGVSWEEEVEAVFAKEGGDKHAVHVLED